MLAGQPGALVSPAAAPAVFPFPLRQPPALPSLIEIDREILRRGRLADFVKLAWPLVVATPLEWSWHMDLMCSTLERVTSGELLRVIFNVPPGSSKSLIVSVLWPAWERIHRPAERWLVASFDHSLVRNHSVNTLKILQSDWLAQRIPDFNLGLPQAINHNEWFTRQGGFHFVTSIDGKGTGRHGTRKVVDDPTKPKDVRSDQLAKANMWWDNTWSSRNAVSDPAEVIVMQRLAEEDLTGHVLALDGEWSPMNRLGWLLVSLPAEFDPERAFRSPWGDDPRTCKGELLTPRLTPEYVAKQRRTLGPVTYAAQYDQNPTPAGGQILQASWFRRYADTGSDLLRDAGTIPLPESPDYKLISCDLNFGNSEGSSDVAILVFAIKGVQAFVIDAFSERIGFLDTLAQLQSIVRKHPGATVLIENKANGPSVIDTINRKIPGVVPEEPHGNKIARMIAISGYVQAGNVAIPHEREDITWMVEFTSQVLKFPRGKKKDLADSFSQGVRYLFADGKDGAVRASLANPEVEQWLLG